MLKWGSRPMNGQLSCEGPLGQTTLKESPPGAVSPASRAHDLDPGLTPPSRPGHLHAQPGAQGGPAQRLQDNELRVLGPPM